MEASGVFYRRQNLQMYKSLMRIQMMMSIMKMLRKKVTMKCKVKLKV